MRKTKICPHCGKEIMASAEKCRYCGEWIDHAPQKAHSTKPAHRELMPCPVCGELVDRKTDYCPYCKEYIGCNHYYGNSRHHSYNYGKRYFFEKYKYCFIGGGALLLLIVLLVYPHIHRAMNPVPVEDGSWTVPSSTAKTNVWVKGYLNDDDGYDDRSKHVIENDIRIADGHKLAIRMSNEEGIVFSVDDYGYDKAKVIIDTADGNSFNVPVTECKNGRIYILEKSMISRVTDIFEEGNFRMSIIYLSDFGNVRFTAKIKNETSGVGKALIWVGKN